MTSQAESNPKPRSRAFDWFKVCLVAVPLAAAFAGALFYYTRTPFSLSGLDLFFALTTALSLFINFWQVSRDRYKYTPLKNSLIAVFNDLKGKQLRVYQRGNLVVSPSSMAASAESIRREFFDFITETNLVLEQLKEHIVGAIHTLDPSASSEQVFKAGEFGLNDQELRIRRDQTERFAAANPMPAPPVIPAEPPSTAPTR